MEQKYLFVLRFAQQNLPEAKVYAEKAARIYDRDLEVQILLGRIALVEDRLEDAASHFLIAIRENPRAVDPAVYYALAVAKMGKYEESLEIARVTVQQFPSNMQARFLMAVNLYKLGQRAEAREYFDWNSSLTETEKVQLLEEF